MSQLFSPEGEVVPVTLIKAEKNQVGLHRTEEKDNYNAVQLSLPNKNPNRAHVATREFPLEVAADVKELGVDQFEEGDVVEVVGTSKGKGFQGVVKRHNFKGGPASHGHRHVLRSPGSIGAAFPQHVFKGQKMAGRMGADQVTVKNLIIAKVDAEQNVIAVKGAVPGKRGSVVVVKTMAE